MNFWKSFFGLELCGFCMKYHKRWNIGYKKNVDMAKNRWLFKNTMETQLKDMTHRRRRRCSFPNKYLRCGWKCKDDLLKDPKIIFCSIMSTIFLKNAKKILGLFLTLDRTELSRFAKLSLSFQYGQEGWKKEFYFLGLFISFLRLIFWCFSDRRKSLGIRKRKPFHSTKKCIIFQTILILIDLKLKIVTDLFFMFDHLWLSFVNKPE